MESSLSPEEKRVAIVTGAGNGIGFEICRVFAESGIKVILNDINEELAAKSAEAIREAGGECVSMGGDASDVGSVEALVQKALDSFGRVDIAVANAGITGVNRFLDMKPEQLRQMLDVNLVGSVFLAQKAAQQMIRQGEGGRIIFMSSVVGHLAHIDLACYGMTKAALQMLAKSLVIELAEYGITTNAISPGAVATERTLSTDPNFVGLWQKAIPTRKIIKPSDIAQAALFLASPQASQINGHTLLVDGGWTTLGKTPFDLK